MSSPTDPSDRLPQSDQSSDTDPFNTMPLNRGDQSASPRERSGREGPRVRRVGDYELIAELGRGGMGVVYKARDLKLGRLVALKMIRGGSHASTADVERFIAEAKAEARLDHPHVVPVYEIGENDGLPFFAMALVEGGSLHQRIGEGPLPAKVAARLVQQVAEAVQHAHERGVIHRDLKPHNILLHREDASSSGLTPAPVTIAPGTTARSGSGSGTEPRSLPGAMVPKVSDFGLARLVGEDGRTVTGEVLGTPSYMPPEQAAGRTKDVGPLSDVYSLGAVLYAALTGRPPFQAASTEATILQVINQEPLPPRQFSPVPRDLETICLKCLQKESAQRYPSAQALAEDLRRFLSNEPIVARPVSRPERAWRWVRKYPVVAGLMAAVALLLVAVAAVGVYAAVQFQAKYKAEADARSVLESQLYANRIAVAERELSLNQDINLASDLLEKCPPHLRGWEWDYLTRLRDGEQPPLKGHTGGLWLASFRPDGKRIASASIDGTVRVWDVASGKTLLTYKGHVIPLLPTAMPVMAVDYSPDGKWIASGSMVPNPFNLRASTGVVKVWDAETGEERCRFQQHTGLVLAVVFRPDGRQVASTSLDRDNSFAIWDAATGELLHRVTGHEGSVNGLRYSPDGKLLASASTDGSVRLWDTTDYRLVRVIPAHPTTVSKAAFSPDSQRVLSAGFDGTVRVWDVATGQLLLTLRGHTGSALAVAVSPDGKRIASGGFDNTVRVWDAQTGEEKLTLRGHIETVWSVEFTHDGRKLASASFDGNVRIWDASPPDEETGPGVFTLLGHSDRVNRAIFSSDGKHLATAAWDATVRLWDAKTGKELRILTGPTAVIWGLAFSPTGDRVAGASWDRSVRIWDVETGRELALCTGHLSGAHCVAFSPDGKHIASGSWDGIVKVWDAATGKETASCDKHLFPAMCVAFSPDGRLASGSGDRSIVIWDPKTGKELLTCKGHNATVTSLAFNLDGSRLVSSSWDKTVKVWDAKKGKELLTLSGHRDRLHAVALSPDGHLIASGGDDKDVRVWDAATGKEVMSPRRHRGYVWSVTFSGDSRRVAVATWSTAGWVKVWELPPEMR